MTLLVLEAGVRVVGAVTAAKTLGDLRDSARKPGKGKAATLGRLIRVHPDPRVVYELKPDLEVEFRGVRTSTNSAGFRGRERRPQPDRNTVRIVGIGDSTMFGWGVADGRDFLSLLEDRLNREYPERAWEVVNTAVPGYNTMMEVATLEEKGLRYQPDLVVLDVSTNDLQLPYFMLEREDYLRLESSMLYEFVRKRLSGVGEASDDQPGLAKQEYAKLRDIDMERIPPVYRDMVGWAAFKRSFENLVDLADRHGFEIVVTCAHGKFLRTGRRYLAAEGFPALCSEPARRRFLEAEGLSGGRGSIMTLGESDSHPSELGHRLMADLLFDELVESGFVDRHRDEPSVRSLPAS